MVITTGFPATLDFKAVLLDIDNTIYPYDPCHEAALRHCFEEFCQTVKKVEYTEFLALYNAARKEVGKRLAGQAASHSRFLYFQRVFECLLDRTEISLTMHFHDVYWRRFYDELKPTNTALEFLSSCQTHGIHICLVTDLTSSVQFRKIQALGIQQYVTYVVTSEEAGAEKPDPRIFQLALSKLGLLSDQVVIVGDSVEKDIAGAANLNIRAFHVEAFR